MSGIGKQPAGGTPFGIGTPATAPPIGGVILRDPITGSSTGSRRLDPITKDYVVDEFGRILGMNDVQQLVELAVSTDRGSSAVRTLGQELKKIDRITDNFVRRVTSTFERALKPIVDAGLIEVRSITVTKDAVPGRAFAVVVWRDLTTDTEQTTKV